LRNYAIGDCDNATSEEIERHLAACPACEDTIAGFDSADDTLMRHLPLAAVGTQQTGSDRPGWLERLRSGPPADSADDVHSQADQQPAASLGGLSAYELLGVLGRGGMGVVYRARHRQLNRIVAIKVLSPRMVSAAEARRRFEREIQILGSLNHPGVVMATDAGRIGSAAYLVMELVQGADLARLVRRGGPLAVAEACEVGRQMAAALAAAHALGTIHRDVKPSNAMADGQGRVKLLDFGLAHLATLAAEHRETSLGRLLGTLDYMAPEQADSGQAIDARADLYGLGATLFFLLTGRPPHGADTERSLLEQLRAVASSEAPHARSLRTDVHDELDELVARLLSRDPAARPDSAEEVAAQLSRWAGGDLAARVMEMDSIEDQRVAMFDDDEEARRSLSELLGVGSATPSETEPLVSHGKPKAYGVTAGRLVWLAAITAGIAAILFGVTILLQTPKGTLRIESDLANVRVELVDEQAKTSELTIDRGPNEIVLRAGRYRVRLAGEHDGLAIDHGVITLRRGEQVVARVTRSAEGGKDVAGSGVSSAGEHVYQGQPESVWQRRYDAERAPLAKLEAATALVTLASELPPEQRADRIVEIGGTFVEAAWGDGHLLFSMRALDVSVSSFTGTRWPFTKQEELQTAFYEFRDLFSIKMTQIPPRTLADRLCHAITDAEPHPSSFAAWLISRPPVQTHIGGDAAAVEVVMRKLRIPPQGLDRSAVAVFVRASFYDSTPDEQRKEIDADLSELADRLWEAPSGDVQDAMTRWWLEIAKVVSLSSERPAGLMERAARLILRRVIDRGADAISFYYQSRWFRDDFPYADAWAMEVRKETKYFLDSWIPVVNRYLQEHRDATPDRAMPAIVQTLDYTLRVHFSDDDWDVETTAALLTEELREYYTTQASPPAAGAVDDLPSTSPAMLLTQIARINGKIPEFVREGRPRARKAAEKLAAFERMLAEGATYQQLNREIDKTDSLIELAPYHAIKLAVGGNKLDRNINVEELLYAFSGSKIFPASYGREGGPPADPMLMLVVLADLAGQSEAQDARIAEIFGQRKLTKLLTRDINEILSGPWAMQKVVHGLLRQIVNQSKSERLTQTVQNLYPTVFDRTPIDVD